jgi:hypothetical protein
MSESVEKKSFSTKNYSIEANYQALENLVSSNPQLWSDKYLLGTGAQLLRVISAGQSANGVRTLQALYESCIGFMQREDSLLGFAETMGYSTFRGSNDIIQVIIKANQTVSIPSRTVIGSVQNVDLVNIEPLVINEGETVAFQAKVGTLSTETKSIVDTEYKYIRFLNDKVSDDVLFYRNDQPVNYVTNFKDVFSDEEDISYIMLTNAYGSVDVFILNRNPDNAILASDTFSINFIEYTDINYSQADVICDYGTVLQVTSVENGTVPEAKESIRVNTPYFRDTQREVLANRDPIKILQLALPGVESTAGINLNTVHSLLTYKYPDYHLIPDEQLKQYETQLAPQYYFGFCPSNIVQPIQYHTGLNIEIVLKSPKTEISSIRDMVTEILKAYEKLPETNSIGNIDIINLDDIESQLNKLEINGERVVKTAYVNLAIKNFSSTARLRLGEIYKQGSLTVRLKNFKYHTSIPLPAEYTSQYTPSDQVLLEQWRLIYGYTPLQPNAFYETDAIVGRSDTEIYRVHPNFTLPDVQPVWNSTLGSYTYQGNLIWLTVKQVPGTSYTAGAYAIKGMVVTPTGSDVSYQLIGFTKTVNTLTSQELVTEVVSTNQRTIQNIWNSYTVFGIESLNIHV